MHFSRFPRFHFAHLPTPLEPLKNLTAELGGPNIWIKRDDCTGLAGGGNKTRKLEFLMAEAEAQNADTIITQGATQSNHARQTAAISAKLNKECHILLEDRLGSNDPDYNFNGNVMLDQLYNAQVSVRAKGSNMDQEMADLAAQLKSDGKKPYVIPGGGSNEVGALGYVNAAAELLYQTNCMSLKIDRVIHATGSAGTQSGLVTGFVASGSGIPVLGIGVRVSHEKQEESVFNLACRVADYIGVGDVVKRDHVVANCNYVGEGYGIPTEGTVDAMKLLAHRESILLDPVYSGKGMNGMIDLVRKGEFENDKNIVFIHTGGSTGLFGYRNAFGFPDYR